MRILIQFTDCLATLAKPKHAQVLTGMTHQMLYVYSKARHQIIKQKPKVYKKGIMNNLPILW